MINNNKSLLPKLKKKIFSCGKKGGTFEKAVLDNCDSSLTLHQIERVLGW